LKVYLSTKEGVGLICSLIDTVYSQCFSEPIVLFLEGNINIGYNTQCG